MLDIGTLLQIDIVLCEFQRFNELCVFKRLACIAYLSNHHLPVLSFSLAAGIQLHPTGVINAAHRVEATSIRLVIVAYLTSSDERKSMMLGGSSRRVANSVDEAVRLQLTLKLTWWQNMKMPYVVSMTQRAFLYNHTI